MSRPTFHAETKKVAAEGWERQSDWTVATLGGWTGMTETEWMFDRYQLQEVVVLWG
jgi:hypothetical protein